MVIKGAWPHDNTLLEHYGWHHPVLSKHDLAKIPEKLAQDIRAASIEELEPDQSALAQEAVRRLSLLQGTVQYLFNGNGVQALPPYFATLDSIRRQFDSLLGWRSVKSEEMPAAIARRLRSVDAQISRLAPRAASIQSQMDAIERAHETALALPEDMESLSEARREIASASDKVTELTAKIVEKEEVASGRLSNIKEKEEEANRIIALCEEAYRASTTRGLASAFDQRAEKLNDTMHGWVLGLVLALVTGVTIGYFRITALNDLLAQPTDRWPALLVHLAVSTLSLGAPVWFAWIATKQIGQRFRLAEDYAFKAAVARAYEGYRTEAARIDEGLENRLFSSALDRLDEAPLRLIESTAHGSPFHEFLSSDAFKKALASQPDLGTKLIESLRASLGVGAATARAPEKP